jgi:hypothetical protein
MQFNALVDCDDDNDWGWGEIFEASETNNTKSCIINVSG